MRVLVIPEDFRKDQYVLKPVVEALFKRLGKPRTKVKILTDPLLGGVDQALTWARVEEIIDRYRMMDLFLLIVDRDGNTGRRDALDNLEQRATNEAGVVLFGEHAWQEIEVWALAGQPKLPRGWVWGEIRAEIHPKETYFLPLVESLGIGDEPGEGRKTLGKIAGQNYTRVRSRCPEDIQVLEARVKASLA